MHDEANEPETRSKLLKLNILRKFSRTTMRISERRWSAFFLKNKGVVLNRRKFLRQLGSESRGKHIEFTSVRFKIHNYFWDL